MSNAKLKKELVNLIENIDNEEMLSLLKEDIVFYGKVENRDITDSLTKVQLKELKALSEEDDLKETQSLSEFKKATGKWRMK
ncbi:MAG: hypothetical protein HYR66_02035 [Sphingobacteriales bacterium]|nr:hypothetical protein [Sphingobacteriales bacterium]MBI3717334.1 hypothetical protein [Sphingobacteriales bacterium]